MNATEPAAGHLTPEAVSQFSLGRLSPDLPRALHHLSGCASCRARVGGAATGASPPFEATAAWDRAVARARAALPPDDGSDAALERLLGARNPLEELNLLPRPTARQVSALCALPARHNHRDPPRAMRLAAVAYEAAERLDPASLPPAAYAALRLHAAAVHANGCRLAGDAPRARQLLAEAAGWLEQCSDAGLRALHASMAGALALDLGDFAGAERNFRRAASLYRASGFEANGLGCDLSAGCALSEGGDARRALALFAALEARAHLLSPDLRAAHVHNWTHLLYDLGDCQGALARLEAHDAVYAENEWLRPRGIWLRGKCLAGLDQHAAALRRFDVARELLAGSTLAVAFVTLDAVASAFALGDTARVAAEAAWLHQMFLAQGVIPDALAAAQLLNAAVRQETFSLAVLAEVEERLTASLHHRA